MDLISRAEAVKAIMSLPTWWADEGGYYGGAQPPMEALLDPQDAVSAIENLPAAQPEIVRCKDCKYWREYKYVNGRPKYLPYCGFNDSYFREDDYCSHAERRGG